MEKRLGQQEYKTSLTEHLVVAQSERAFRLHKVGTGQWDKRANLEKLPVAKAAKN